MMGSRSGGEAGLENPRMGPTGALSDLPTGAAPRSSNAGRRILAAALAVPAVLLVLIAVRVTVFRGAWDGRTVFIYSFGFEGGIRGVSLATSARLSRDAAVAENSPAARTGLRWGDRVLAVNGVSLDDSLAVARLLARSSPGDTLVYRVSRSGDEVSVPVPQGGEPRPVRLLGLLVRLLVAGAFLALGALVHWQRPSDRRAAVFLFLSTAAGSYFLLSGLLHLGPTRLLAPFILQTAGWLLPGVGTLHLGLGTLFVVLLMHLALVFPGERPTLARHPRLMTWVYCAAGAIPLLFWLPGLLTPLEGARRVAVAGTLIAALALAGFFALRQGTGGVRRRLAARPVPATSAVVVALILLALAGPVIPDLPRPWLFVALVPIVPFALSVLAALAMVVACTVATVVAVARSYRQRGIEERAQVRWPLWGTFAAVAGGALLGAGKMLTLRHWRSPGGELAWDDSGVTWIFTNLQILAAVLIPATFAVGILKYRLMEIDLVIRRTVVYGCVTVLLVASYFAVVGTLGGWLVQAAGVKSHWVTAFGTLAVAGAFVPVRNRVQSVVDRRFFRTRYSAAESLQHVSAAVAGASDGKALAQRIAEELQQTLRTRTAAVFVVGAATKALLPTGAVGLADEWIGSPLFGLDPEAVGALGPAPVLDVAALPRPLLDVTRVMRGALLLRVGEVGKARAAIALGTKLSDERFEAADLEYVMAVAHQLAAGLSRLSAAGRQHEFDEARQIQAGLLPRSLPSLRGVRLAASWQPAREVAGDYYDVFALGEDVAALCIADVTGKGMPAALLMSNLQATVKAFAAEDEPPRRLCERVNRMMSENVSPGRFITFFYGVLDARARTLTYVNAGHNPPLLLRADGVAGWLDVGGLLLGVFPEATYEEAAVVLMPGDRLLVYTDGVTEAGDPTGDLFGEERLVEALRQASGTPEEIQRAILASAAAFCGGEFDDDATVVVAVVE